MNYVKLYERNWINEETLFSPCTWDSVWAPCAPLVPWESHSSASCHLLAWASPYLTFDQDKNRSFSPTTLEFMEKIFKILVMIITFFIILNRLDYQYISTISPGLYIYHNLEYGDIKSGQLEDLHVKKIFFICMQSKKFKNELILKFKMISRTCLFFMMAFMVYE